MRSPKATPQDAAQQQGGDGEAPSSVSIRKGEKHVLRCCLDLLVLQRRSSFLGCTQFVVYRTHCFIPHSTFTPLHRLFCVFSHVLIPSCLSPSPLNSFHTRVGAVFGVDDSVGELLRHRGGHERGEGADEGGSPVAQTSDSCHRGGRPGEEGRFWKVLEASGSWSWAVVMERGGCFDCTCHL